MTDLCSVARPAGTVVIAGQGYVGLSIAMRAVEVGYDVVGYEPDSNRAKRLLSRSSYVEDVSDEVLSAALASGRYEPSDAIELCEGFDVVVITVPTPLTEGAPDLSYIERSARELAPYVRPGSAVILESTTYPGTQGPPRSSSYRFSRRVPGWSPVATSGSATAPSGSIRAIPPGPSETPRRWCRGSTIDPPSPLMRSIGPWWMRPWWCRGRRWPR